MIAGFRVQSANRYESVIPNRGSGSLFPPWVGSQAWGGLYDTATLCALSSGIDLGVWCAVFLIVVCAFVGWVWFAVRVFVYSVVCFLRL